MDVSLIAALFTSGLLGSLGHCVGMCGPLTMMAALQMRSSHLSVAWAQAAYQLGRIGVYAALGAAAGAMGSLLSVAAGLNGLGGVLSIALGLGAVLVALSYFGLLPHRAAGASSRLSAAMGRALRRGGILGALALGGLNGLLPCGLAYGALLVAASLGSAGAAALGMLVFGAATVPALAAVAAGGTALGGRGRSGLAKASGLVMLAAGLQLDLRGLATLGLVSHLSMGGVMFW